MTKNKKILLPILILAFVAALVGTMVLSTSYVSSGVAHAAEGEINYAPETATHDHSDGTWQSLSSSDLPMTDDLASGKYYLINHSGFGMTREIKSGVNITICLNGYAFILRGNGGQLKIAEGGSLTICDCNSTGNSYRYYKTANGAYAVEVSSKDTGFDAGAYDTAAVKGTITGGVFLCNPTLTYNVDGLAVDNGGTLNIEGGTITGYNGSPNVAIYNNGTMTMSGGAVVGNVTTNTAGGGGIHSSRTFTMTGGLVQDNTATAGQGGGILFATDNTNANITGGIITGNTATGGAGISVQGGTVNISGCTITGNTTSGSGIGGGLLVKPASNGGNPNVTVSNTTISNNTASQGGGVYVRETAATLKFNSGTITGNNATDNGGAVYASNTQVTISGGTISDNQSSQATGFRVQGTSTLAVSGGTVEGSIITQGTVNVTGGTVEGSSRRFYHHSRYSQCYRRYSKLCNHQPS